MEIEMDRGCVDELGIGKAGYIPILRCHVSRDGYQYCEKVSTVMVGKTEDVKNGKCRRE